MAILDSKGEIVPTEPPNPEKSQILEGTNESVRSRQHLILHLLSLFDKQGLDAMVTVWLTSKKNRKSWHVFVLCETVVNLQLFFFWNQCGTQIVFRFLLPARAKKFDEQKLPRNETQTKN